MSASRFTSLLGRGVAEIISEQELVGLLESGKSLRLKQGFDPSRPDIHLGHVVGLRKLRQLQELGHQVILIVGDWTAQIGDPSGMSATRPMLSPEEVRANAETYLRQFFKVVDKDKTQVRLQSEWFGKFNLGDVIRLTSKFTVAQFLAREDFNKRYTGGQPIAITELLYPLLQAYDSVAIQADVEFGGVDQKFNCLVGRELQQMMGQRPQQILLVPLLAGTDGTQKMSKSLNNYIGVDEPPQEMYGKTMSIPDHLIMPYFELLTDVSQGELEEFSQQLRAQTINPMLLKKRLAREIVTQFHGAESARMAEEHFTRVFQKGKVSEDIAECLLTRQLLAEVAVSTQRGEDAVVGVRRQEQYVVSMPLLLVRTGLVKTRSEAKRLIAQGAVDVDDITVSENDWKIAIGSVIRVGKRRFVKLVSADKP